MRRGRNAAKNSFFTVSRRRRIVRVWLMLASARTTAKAATLEETATSGCACQPESMFRNQARTGLSTRPSQAID